MEGEEVACPALADMWNLLYTPVRGHAEFMAGYPRHVCRHKLTAHTATYHPLPSFPSPTLAFGSRHLIAEGRGKPDALLDAACQTLALLNALVSISR